MKITLKALKDMLMKTLFLRKYLSIVIDREHSTDTTTRIYFSYRNYQVEMCINYDCHSIYLNFSGRLDGFDANEWLRIKADLYDLKGW